MTKADVDKYYEERCKWYKNNPIPVELVNYCSGDYPMYIIAIPNQTLTSNRGYPTELKADTLKIDEQAAGNLINFCEKYNIAVAETPKWWLSSYYG